MREYFLKTQRIGFSHWEQADLPLARALWGDPAVTRYIAASGSLPEEAVAARLQSEISNQIEAGMQYWPLFLLEDEAFVGCCGLRLYEAENGLLELGFHLRPAYWGKGLAREAASAAIGYAFGVLGAKGLFAGHHPDNAASRALLEKLGFRFVRDEYYPPTGLQHPSYLYTPKQK